MFETTKFTGLGDIILLDFVYNVNISLYRLFMQEYKFNLYTSEVHFKEQKKKKETT